MRGSAAKRGKLKCLKAEEGRKKAVATCDFALCVALASFGGGREEKSDFQFIFISL